MKQASGVNTGSIGTVGILTSVKKSCHLASCLKELTFLVTNETSASIYHIHCVSLRPTVTFGTEVFSKLFDYYITYTAVQAHRIILKLNESEIIISAQMKRNV